MKNREYGDYVEDILKAIEAIERFIEGMEFDGFRKDEKTNFAVVRSIEIIGEAAKNIPKAVKEKYYQVPWKEMAGMRDKVIHEYFGVDLRVVWQTAKEDIPSLKPLLEDLSKDLR